MMIFALQSVDFKKNRHGRKRSAACVHIAYRTPMFATNVIDQTWQYMQLLEGTAVSDIDIYAGLGGGKKRVRRDDGKIFDSIAAASMSAYGYAGSGIKRAITTGHKAKGHHWYWADEISEDSQR